MADLRFNVSAETRAATAALGSFAQSVQKNLVQAVRALPNIEITADSSDAEREMKRIRDEMADLANKKVGVDIDAEAAVREVERLQNELQQLSGSTADVSIRANADQASKSLDSIQQQVRQLDGADAEVEVTADTAPAEQELEGFADAAKASAMAAGVGAGAILASAFAQNLEMGEANAKLEAQLGAGTLLAEDAGKVAGNLYANAYGASLGEVNEAVRAVVQSGAVMEDATTEQIESITGKVMSLAGAFDQDLGATVSAVAQMVRTGLAKDADEALDILTRGFQEGNDKAGDLLDTFNEYGTQFRKLGVDGRAAMGLIEQGLKAGARDADIVADAFKEFSIRAVDGSKEAAESFKALGLDAGEMQRIFAKGGPEAAAALDLVFERLKGTQGQADAATIAFGLFGTQSEDLGAALYQLDPSQATQRLGEVAGAAERLDQTMGETAQAKVTALQRGFEGWTQSLIATEGPIGDVAAHLAAFGPMALTAVGAIAPLILALKMQGVAGAIRSGPVAAVDEVGAAADRAGKKVGDGKSGLGGKLGGLKGIGGAVALAAIAKGLDEINVAAAGGPEKLGLYEDSLHNVVGAAGQIASGDVASIFQEIAAEWNGTDLVFDIQADPAAALASRDSLIKTINESSGEIAINGNRMPAGAALQEVLGAIARGEASVNINGQTLPADMALTQIVDQINATGAEVLINGNPMPAGDALRLMIEQGNAAHATMTFDGNADPATGKLQGTIDLGNGSISTLTLDANPDPASGRIRGTVDLGNGSLATITIDGNQEPANGKVNATVDYGNGKTSTVTVDADNFPAWRKTDDVTQHANNQRPRFPVNADPGPAEGVIGRLKQWASSAVNFVVNAVTGNYAGGIYGPPHYLATGGVVGGARYFAGGGLDVDPMSGRRMTRMPTGVPAVAPPGHLRVFGDRPDVPESYIPWKPNSARAHQLLDTTAAALGRTVLPRGATAMAGGGLLPEDSWTGGRASGPAAVAHVAGGMAARVLAAVGTTSGAAGAGGVLRVVDDAARAEIHALRADIAKRTGEQQMAGALRTLATALAARQAGAASATAQAGLTRSELGAW